MYIDIAVGHVIGFAGSFVTGEESLSLIAFGVFATLVPDLDFLVWLARNKWQIGRFSHEHRDIFHLPLPVGIGGGALIAFLDPILGLVWCLGTLAHFVHDTLDGGWGIQWFFPVYRGYFTLVPYSPKRYIRDREEQRELAIIHGTPHWTDWNHGASWNVKFLTQLGVLGIVLIVFVILFLVSLWA